MDRRDSAAHSACATKLEVTSSESPAPFPISREALLRNLDSQRGLLLYSNYEFPGRYSRFDIGFVNPPIVFESCERQFSITALNERGRVLLEMFLPDLRGQEQVFEVLAAEDGVVRGMIQRDQRALPEELRTRQNSVFSVIRHLLSLIRIPEVPRLGLYGAFSYDLVSQFETIRRRIPRSAAQRDTVLYLPDELLVTDYVLNESSVLRFEFSRGALTTKGLERSGAVVPFVPAAPAAVRSDHAPGEYADVVVKARERFACGDLFEVVPGQEFATACSTSPSEISATLSERNPAPYGFLLNLGAHEFLVGASPEMYVRVTGRRLETCPISGTIARGDDAIGDSEQILRLLNSQKDKAELTMCTDVDRNDKSRVCIPGSVRVIGRRQIELYSRLIHTVDHIEGVLRDEFDGVDAFLTHAWAVTVTGAPKRWAMQFIEDHERTPRCWYGGAVGMLYANGDVNTGLTLRTVHIVDGEARVRAGSTLLFDSDPAEEERETVLKAGAFLDAVIHRQAHAQRRSERFAKIPGRRVFFVDHDDSFVLTLTNYFSQLGAEVATYRSDVARSVLPDYRPDLVVLSPGPGSPKDFKLHDTIQLCLEHGFPMFGVCLGLQGLVEYFGGKLSLLSIPWHGKSSPITAQPGILFEGLPSEFEVGRYHSLCALVDDVPQVLHVTAWDSAGVAMAIEHRELPVCAVQFHPESIMTAHEDSGLKIVRNVLATLCRR